MGELGFLMAAETCSHDFFRKTMTVANSRLVTDPQLYVGPRCQGLFLGLAKTHVARVGDLHEADPG